MSTSERVARFRRQVAECQAKAVAARSEENRRAWLICARGWQSMVEKEELRYVSEPASTLIPSGPNTEVEAVLKDLAKKSRD
jgi:hypothetical protein